ncbi:Pao retrotransposon peptidase [Popillia japonica]|uniref:Pao retrotransposon peptidase n=1 Tax=Popillia japonica TaxID=7064 RepID=A0AAW1MYB2_POPJA
MLTGANSKEETAQIAKGVSNILKQGCFELRKFYANDPDILKDFVDDASQLKVLKFGQNENAKTLGLVWCPSTDVLKYNISDPPKGTKISKRTILSQIAQVFDPLGLLSPYIINAKILLQQLWLEKVTWDEGLPLHIHSYWTKFRSKLSSLNDLCINRHVCCKDQKYIELHGFSDASEKAYGACIYLRTIDRTELHGFSDASEKAYGACIYLRTIDRTGKIFVSLLCSKTKVAPLKKITLPRSDNPADCLSRGVQPDESQVLQLWWNGPNPADCLSRGVQPDESQVLQLWWNGPSWLGKEKAEWPKQITLSKAELPETKSYTQSFISYPLLTFSFENFSNLQRLKRVLSWILRFKNNCQRKEAGKPIQPIMGQLPKFRVQPASPFNTTGVDYAGPFRSASWNASASTFRQCVHGIPEVLESDNGPETNDNNSYRRNTTQLHKTKAEIQEDPTVIPNNETIVPRDESNPSVPVSPRKIPEAVQPIVTRSGRQVKPINRLDL